jgi:hypothetical protein
MLPKSESESAATMPAEETAPPAESMEGEETPATEPTAEGYMLALKVTPEGMTACKKPLPPAEPADQSGADGSEYQEIAVESIEQGLKALVALYRQNPIGQSEQKAFDAGYQGQQSGNPAQRAGGY